MPRRRQAPVSTSTSDIADDGQELLAAAAAKVGKKVAAASQQTATGKPAAGISKPRRQRRRITVSEDGETINRDEDRQSSDPWSGAHSSVNHESPRPVFGAVLCTIVATTILALSVIAWRNGPDPVQASLLQAPPEVPRALFRQWVQAFPDSEALFQRPDLATMEAFAAFLSSQPAVRRVETIRLDPSSIPENGALTLQIQLDMRRPLLPVILASGERAWISDDGVLLPGILDGPRNMPMVRGLEGTNNDIIMELIQIWPSLSQSIASFMPNLISEIHVDAAMPQSNRPGLVFHTRPGTRLVWGSPEEHRFGVDQDKRLRNLIHTLRCQGDLRRVPEINVRFHEPFAIVR
ncbi:MAG: cell division protein FtsQ [Planctomycetota bacterium]|nr:MAG: cell division protein FtsQ [Planctomycetota bacterium]